MTKEFVQLYPILCLLLFFKDFIIIGLFLHVTAGIKTKVINLLSFSLIISIVNLLIRYNFEFNLIFLTIIASVIILASIFILKLGIIRSITLTLLAQIIALIVDLVVMLFFSQFNLTKEHFMNNVPLILLGNLIASIVFFFVILSVYYAKIRISFAEDISRKRNIGILLNALITLSLVSPNVVFFIWSTFDIPKGIIIFNVLALIIFFSLSTYNTYKSNELEIKKNDLEYQKLYNKTLNDLIDGLRTFKHDFANILSSIGGYIALNDQKGLKKYFSELMDDFNSVNNLSSISSTIINNPAIYGLIVSKLYMAETKGIKMNTDITTDLNNSQIKIYELCKILGILLDNAIEAAFESIDKLVNITIKRDNINNAYLVIIENTYSGNININEIFNKGVSTKGEGRGLGLWEVKSITNRYKTVSLHTKVNDHTFTQELYLEPIILKAVV